MTQEIYPMRLQKFLARAGAASRRGSENLMTDKRVTVNGKLVTELGSKVDPQKDTVCIDGIEISLNDSNVYLMLNKPAGYLTTMSDPQGRPTIKELVPHEQYPGLFPVGRLDFDTTGLLLFMTDGECAYKLLHPKYEVSKRYEALVCGVLTDADAQKLRVGVELSDGVTAPATVEIGEVSMRALTFKQRLEAKRNEHFVPEQTRVWCTITEGRNRQVKRMFAALGHDVLSLKRLSFAGVELGGLKIGKWRMLSEQETIKLDQKAPAR